MTTHLPTFVTFLHRERCEPRMNGQADGEVDYKRKYKNLKRKLKFLIYVSDRPGSEHESKSQAACAVPGDVPGCVTAGGGVL